MLEIERAKQADRHPMLYAGVAAAAAIIVAICIYDAASADMGLSGRPVIQRAGVGAW